MEFLHYLESIRTPHAEVFFSACTFLGSQAVLFVMFALNYWCIDKKFGYEICTSFFLSALLVQGIKITCRVPRPFVKDITLRPSELAVGGATGYSFPSGHTQTSSSVMIPAAVEYRKKPAISVICVILLILTAFSRLYLCVHTPQDVIVSFLITAACAAGVMLLRRRTSEDGMVRIFSVILLAGSVFTVIYAVLLKNRGIIESNYLADCIKNAGACLGYIAGIFFERKYVQFEAKVSSPKEGIIKVVCGLLGAGVILYGMKLLYSGVLFLDGLRYFLVSFWILFIYPFVYRSARGKTANKTV